MKFFLDTASLNEIREGCGVGSSLMELPLILRSISKEGDVDFKQHVAAICEIVQGGLFSAEVTSQDRGTANGS